MKWSGINDLSHDNFGVLKERANKQLIKIITKTKHESIRFLYHVKMY